MPPRTRTYTLALTGLLLGLQGCSDDTPTSAGPVLGDAALSQAVSQSNDPVEHRWACRTKLESAT